MSTDFNLENSWASCYECKGQGKKRHRLRKNKRLFYEKALEKSLKSNGEIPEPVQPESHLVRCETCLGKGILLAAECPEVEKTDYPHIAIIGAGIGGCALAIACLHRGIPFSIYERDLNFESRSQGYGLTLQQARKTIEALGISELVGQIISTKHVMHNPDGKVLGMWGAKKWLKEEMTPNNKKSNAHISRQALRFSLIQQLGGTDKINWGHRFIDFEDNSLGEMELSLEVDGEIKKIKADLLIGADGIRGAVRNQVFPENISPLNYLGCIVILGICPLSALENIESPLLDSETVFQTANGQERIYMMPFDAKSIMWQLSFPLSEEDAISLSKKGAHSLKIEACKRTQWHSPIPEILAATEESLISGYPVYDREALSPLAFEKFGNVSLLGDAAHPMSPFKGQGANQALLDALSLAKIVTRKCGPFSNWRKEKLRKIVLEEFEAEMLKRSAVKVKDSAEAARFLHSDVVLFEGDEPRGKVLKRIKD